MRHWTHSDAVRRERNLHFLVLALSLPMAAEERALLQNIVHHYAHGTHVDWADANPHREDDVRELFAKIVAMVS